MAYVRITDEKEADGLLAGIYKAARDRAGMIANILKLQSLNPQVLQGCMNLYTTAVRGESPLTRAQREMLAVVVSKINGCQY